MKRRAQKFFAMTLVAVLAVGGLAGCGKASGDAAGDASSVSEENSNVTDESTASADGPLSFLKVGTCVMSFQQEYMINLVEGYEEF